MPGTLPRARIGLSDRKRRGDQSVAGHKRHYAVTMPAVIVPDPALVILVGPSGSGKSTWAAARYRQSEIVCSDELRGIVGSGEHDLDASADAFALLDQIVAARLRRGLNTVVDTLGLDTQRRRAHLELGRQAGLPAVAVLFGTDAAECRRRNRSRARRVPAAVLDSQLRRMPDVAAEIAAEGWVVIRHADEAAPEPSHTAGSLAAASDQRTHPAQLTIVLQISRFPWGDDPAAWLAAVAGAAAEAGLGGIALMDHLIQIPQVGRAWEPIPEPWVTLGMLTGLEPGLRLGTLVTPVTFRAPGILAKTVGTRARGFRPAFPAGAGQARRAGVGDRDAPRPVAARHQGVPERVGPAAGDDLLSAAGIADPGHRRRGRRAAHAGHRCPARRRLQPSLRHRHAGPQARRPASALRGGR